MLDLGFAWGYAYCNCMVRVENRLGLAFGMGLASDSY